MFIVIVLTGALAAAAVVASIVDVRRDGYRPAPTDPSRLP
jgi:hypothetical protein